MDGDIEMNLKPTKNPEQKKEALSVSTVALKFMKNESQYEREVAARLGRALDAKFVIQMVEHFDGSNDRFLNALRLKVIISREMNTNFKCSHTPGS
jgi:hypothetical protein